MLVLVWAGCTAGEPWKASRGACHQHNLHLLFFKLPIPSSSQAIGFVTVFLADAAVSRISLTRPQLASQVEELLVRMGQGGQIRGKVSDEQLKQLLEQVSNKLLE